MKKNGFSVKRLIGGEQLGSSFYYFLTVHTGFLVFARLPSVFLNTLLLGQSQEINVVLLYNAVFFVCGAISMVIAANVLHATSSGVTGIIGILGYNMLYLALVILGNSASQYFVLLGVLTGLADGFYWISYGHLLTETTDMHNRDSGLAIISIFGSVVSLIIPLISGAIISLIGGLKGYNTVFLMAFIVSVLTAVLALRLPKNHSTEKQKVSYGKTFKVVFGNKKLLYALLGQGCKGIREGAFTFILGIVLYQLISNEFVIGLNTFLSAIAAIISYMIMSRLLNLKNRIVYMGAAVVVLSIIAGVSAWWISPLMIFIFSFINMFFCGFIENSCYTTFLDMLQLVPEALNHRPEILAMNECFLVTGRLIGLGIFIAMNAFVGTSTAIQCISLLILTLTQFITMFFCGKAMKLAHKN